MRFFFETAVVFRRQVRLSLRTPIWVLVGLLQPVLYLLLFGPLLAPLAGSLGTDNAYTLFVPGLLIQLAITDTLFAGFALIGEWRDGVVEAERVTPASRAALLLGRVLRDVAQLFLQGVVFVALASLLGLESSPVGVAAGMALMMLVGATCSTLSYSVAIRAKSEDAMSPVINTVTMPLILLSGILLPMTLAPAWLQTLSDFVPTKHIVTAMREFFRGDLMTASTILGAAWAFLLCALALWIGTRSFNRD